MNAKKHGNTLRAVTLPAPSVSEADADNHVAATVTAVTVVVPVWTGMAEQDVLDGYVSYEATAASRGISLRLR